MALSIVNTSIFKDMPDVLVVEYVAWLFLAGGASALGTIFEDFFPPQKHPKATKPFTSSSLTLRGLITMLFMIIEHFRNGAEPVYARFRKDGRLAPPELQYVSSWVTEGLSTCYQVMECEKREYLDQWIASWEDIVDFEVVPVITSKDAAAKFQD